MEEYKSNSYRSKEKGNNPLPEKKIERVVSGNVKSKKKTGLNHIANIFIPEDVEDAKRYVFEDVVVPAVKTVILDAVKSFLGFEGRGTRYSTASKISYRKYYEDRRDDGCTSNRKRTGYDYDDIILDNRGEAEDVLSRMDELIEVYGVVSVGDFYDLVGITGNYTDNKYGWTNIHNASIQRVREGYLIKLPKALPLN